MTIQAINSTRKPGIISFGATQQKALYENPINRSTERNLSILESVGTSALVGTVAGGLTTCCTQGKKLPFAIGLLASIATLALTLPSKLYNTKVTSFTREKEMDTFSRQKEAQANIYESINEEIKDENVSLADKINHYATATMADNGRGIMVR